MVNLKWTLTAYRARYATSTPARLCCAHSRVTSNERVHRTL
jgi:hypothetical protein